MSNRKTRKLDLQDSCLIGVCQNMRSYLNVPHIIHRNQMSYFYEMSIHMNKKNAIDEIFVNRKPQLEKRAMHVYK